MVLIDYKTGRVTTALPWANPERAAAAELRFDYARTLPVFTTLRFATRQKLVGIAGESEQLAEGKNSPVKTTAAESGWTQQRHMWRRHLIGLSAEIAAGDARVNPLPNVCRHCELQPLCRVDEKKREPEQCV